MRFRPIVGVALATWLLSSSVGASPVRDGGETRVNGSPTLYHSEPAVACDRAGACIVVWYTPEYTTPGTVFARLYDRSGKPRGEEFPVNTYVTGDRGDPTVACDAAGNFVVVWSGQTENPDAWEIRARRFAADGTALGNEFSVSTNLVSTQDYPAIAMRPTGEFVVIWVDEYIDKDGSGGLLGRRFDAAGSPAGAPFAVNTTWEDTQTDPAIAIDAAGGFFVAWTSYSQDGDYGAVVGRRFSPSGSPVTAEIAINVTTAGFQGSPSVARQDDGSVLVTWESEGVDADDLGMVGRRFDAAGLPLTGEFLINETSASYQYSYPGATASTPDGAVVPWTSYDQDGDQGTVVARVVSRTGVPSGPEFQVNTTSEGYQYAGRAAADGGGNFIVVWDAPDPDTQIYQIWSQRFSNERRVDEINAGVQAAPKLGMNSSGRFAVVWDSFAHDGQWEGVFGRAEGPAGAPLGAEFQVNTYTTVGQYQPTISSDTNGGFVVVWSSAYQDGSGYGVFGQRYDASGARASGEFQVNTTTEGYQETPVVARRAAGDFVVVWSSYGQDGSSYAIVGQRFDSGGEPEGSEFLVNTTTASAQTAPAVAKNDTGQFVVVWESAAQDGDGWGVAGQSFDAFGSPIGSEFPVNASASGDQRAPVIGLDGFGNSVVVWETAPAPASGREIVGRRFDARGDPLGAEFPINASLVGDQSHPAIAVDASGRFVASWETKSPGPGTDVVVRQFAPDGTPVGDEFPATAATAGDQIRPSVAIDDSGRFAIAWESLDSFGAPAGSYVRHFALAESAGCAPLAVGAPANRIVCTGATATFTVTAQGTGPPGFQWKKDGVPLADGGALAGANGPTLHIAPTTPADSGAYTASVTDACNPPHTVTSAVATLMVNPTPPRVGDTLHAGIEAGQLRLVWLDIPSAEEYVVYEDTAPSGSFATMTGTASGGSVGLTIPIPSTVRYYRVAARNSCGDGPKD